MAQNKKAFKNRVTMLGFFLGLSLSCIHHVILSTSASWHECSLSSLFVLVFNSAAAFATHLVPLSWNSELSVRSAQWDATITSFSFILPNPTDGLRSHEGISAPHPVLPLPLFLWLSLSLSLWDISYHPISPLISTEWLNNRALGNNCSDQTPTIWKHLSNRMLTFCVEWSEISL